MRRAFWLLAALTTLTAACGPGRSVESPDNDRYYFEDIYRPFFAPDAADQSMLTAARPGARQARFERVKPAGVFRVFLVGGSTTAGYNGPGDLQETLQDALPGKKVEVINCGMSGYDSFREALVIDQVLKLQPDLIFLLSGHNDFHMNQAPPPPLWAARLSRALHLARLRALLGLRLPSRPAVLTARAYEARLARFDANLRANIAKARAAGVPIAVGVPPLAYADMAPQVEPPWQVPGFAEGWLAYEGGRWKQARARWAGVLAALPAGSAQRAFVLYFDGCAAEKLGLHEQARQRLLQAADWEGLNVCATSCADVIRKAAQDGGAVLVDVDEAFRRVSAPRLPGLGQFLDQFHWPVRMNRPISQAIIEAMKARPEFSRLRWRPRGAPLPKAAPTTEEEDTQARATLYYALDDAATLPRPKPATPRPGPPLPGRSWRTVTWLDALSSRQPRWFVSADTLWEAAQAVLSEHVERARQVGGFTPAPTRIPQALLLAHAACWFLCHDRAREAADAARRAMAQDPEIVWVEGPLAEAEARLGRRDEARRALDVLAATDLSQEAAALRRALRL